MFILLIIIVHLLILPIILPITIWHWMQSENNFKEELTIQYNYIFGDS